MREIHNEQIIRLLQDGNDYHYLDIATKTGLSKSKVYSTLKDLIEDGTVEQSYTTIQRKNVGFYRLTYRIKE